MQRNNKDVDEWFEERRGDAGHLFQPNSGSGTTGTGDDGPAGTLEPTYVGGSGNIPSGDANAYIDQHLPGVRQRRERGRG